MNKEKRIEKMLTTFSSHLPYDKKLLFIFDQITTKKSEINQKKNEKMKILNYFEFNDLIQNQTLLSKIGLFLDNESFALSQLFDRLATDQVVTKSAFVVGVCDLIAENMPRIKQQTKRHFDQFASNNYLKKTSFLDFMTGLSRDKESETYFEVFEDAIREGMKHYSEFDEYSFLRVVTGSIRTCLEDAKNRFFLENDPEKSERRRYSGDWKLPKRKRRGSSLNLGRDVLGLDDFQWVDKNDVESEGLKKKRNSFGVKLFPNVQKNDRNDRHDRHGNDEKNEEEIREKEYDVSSEEMRRLKQLLVVIDQSMKTIAQHENRVKEKKVAKGIQSRLQMFQKKTKEDKPKSEPKELKSPLINEKSEKSEEKNDEVKKEGMENEVKKDVIKNQSQKKNKMIEETELFKDINHLFKKLKSKYFDSVMQSHKKKRMFMNYDQNEHQYEFLTKVLSEWIDIVKKDQEENEDSKNIKKFNIFKTQMRNNSKNKKIFFSPFEDLLWKTANESYSEQRKMSALMIPKQSFKIKTNDDNESHIDNNSTNGSNIIDEKTNTDLLTEFNETMQSLREKIEDRSNAPNAYGFLHSYDSPMVIFRDVLPEIYSKKTNNSNSQPFDILMKSILDSSDECISYLNNLNNNESKYNELKVRLNYLEDENKRLRTKIEEREFDWGEYDTLSLESKMMKEALQRGLKRIEDEKNDLENENEKLRKEIEYFKDLGLEKQYKKHRQHKNRYYSDSDSDENNNTRNNNRENRRHKDSFTELTKFNQGNKSGKSSWTALNREEELEETIHSLQAEKEGLQHRLEMTEGRLRNSLIDLSKQRHAFEEVEEERIRLTRRVVVIERENERLGQKKDEIERLIEEERILQEKVRFLSNQNDILEDELNETQDLRNTIRELEQKLREKDVKISTLTQTENVVNELRDNISSLKDEIRFLSKERKTLIMKTIELEQIEQDYNILQDKYQDQLNERESARIKLESLPLLMAEVSRLQGHIRSLTETIQQQDHDIMSYNSSRLKIDRELQEKESLEKELLSKEKDLVQLRGENQHYQQQLRELASLKNQLKRKIDELNKTKNQLTLSETRSRNLRSKVSLKENELFEAQEALKNSEKTIARLSHFVNPVSMSTRK